MGLVQFFYNYAIGILYYYNFAFHLETKFVAQWDPQISWVNVDKCSSLNQ